MSLCQVYIIIPTMYILYCIKITVITKVNLTPADKRWIRKKLTGVDYYSKVPKNLLEDKTTYHHISK